jgi:predicted glycogen debranching enzyme
MREWLVTNGLGGYASLTYKNTNTSKFHGLLVGSLNPPTERWVFVSNIIDKIQVNDQTRDLENFRTGFNFDFFPNFIYKSDDFSIKKTVFMQHDKNTTILRYDIKNKKPVTMVHGPIVHHRHIYDVNSQRYMSFEQKINDNVLSVKANDVAKCLKIKLSDSVYSRRDYWETLYYEKDRKRRDSWIDNAVHIGYFYKNIKKPSVYHIVLTIEDDLDFNPEDIFLNEKQRKKKLFEETNLSKKFEKLVISSDNFIVKKGNHKSVIAGYPWFGDWGRDTLIALPGLTLVTRRFSDAKKTLQVFAEYCKDGLIPNAFMERDSVAVYNTVDASLWYIDRFYQYMKYTKDQDFLKKNWSVLESIINGYINGTHFDIKMDDDFLISHGPGLTWMDVKINDYYITPRFRKAVEIQALWYNALRIMSVFASQLEKKDIYLDISKSVKRSFQKQFDMLYDVIDTKDFSFRSNIIFLVSLDFQLIDLKTQKKIVEQVQKELLTVFGLRTLSPHDQNYKAYYIGDYNKDAAYHNGTVWPWLLGSFITAYIKTNKNQEKYRKKAFNDFLKPMLDIYGPSWDGSIHEIFDAEPIYEPRGCISQAWSVAEILRSWVEDIENKKQELEKNLALNEISV